MICTNQDWIQAQAKLSKDRLSSIPASKVEAMNSFVTKTSSAASAVSASKVTPGQACNVATTTVKAPQK